MPLNSAALQKLIFMHKAAPGLTGTFTHPTSSPVLQRGGHWGCALLQRWAHPLPAAPHPTPSLSPHLKIFEGIEAILSVEIVEI